MSKITNQGVPGFAELMLREREHQAKKWAKGDDASLDIHDRSNSLRDWVAFIARYSTATVRSWITATPEGRLQVFQDSMIKVATLAYSAHRWAEFKLQELDDRGTPPGLERKE